MIITILFDQQKMVTNLIGEKKKKKNKVLRLRVSPKPNGCYKSSKARE